MENKEIFKDIRGYEGKYQISNYGRVYSSLTDRILRPNLHKCGYLKVTLFMDGKAKTFLVHRLVAGNFIDNPNNFRDVNHKDGNKTNNYYENLEWCTIAQNTKHAFDNNLGNLKIRALDNLSKIHETQCYKKIILKKGGEIFEFSSTSKAAKALGLKRDNISRAIKKGHRVGGYEVFGYKIANEETLLDDDRRAISWENSSNEMNKPVETIPKGSREE